MISLMIGIVAYNPNVDKLLNTIKNLATFQSCNIYFLIVDNDSTNRDDIISIKHEVHNLEVILLDKNEGIATGLNVIMESAEKRNCSWVLSLDQDTEFNVDMFNKMCSYIKDCSNGIAAICPRIKEKGCHIREDLMVEAVEYVPYCITAGMLVRTDVWRQIGKYDDRMFIDLVDFEFCARISLAGYKICRVNEAILINEIGDNVKEIECGNKNIIIRNHAPIRYYYYTRNMIYCRKKLPEYFTVNLLWKMYGIWLLKVLFFECNKKKKILEIIKGVKDGVRMEVEDDRK